VHPKSDLSKENS